MRSLGKELTCPLCRSDWGDFKWKPPPAQRKKAVGRDEHKDVHYGTKCGVCKKVTRRGGGGRVQCSPDRPLPPPLPCPHPTSLVSYIPKPPSPLPSPPLHLSTSLLPPSLNPLLP